MVINPLVPPWFKSERRSEATHTQYRLLRKLVGAECVMYFKVARCVRVCVRIGKILCNGSLRKALRKREVFGDNLNLLYLYTNAQFV